MTQKSDTLDKDPVIHTTRIDIIRHGECEGGAIFRGSTDVKLTSQGFARMQAASEKFERDWDMIIASPMQRCWQFGQWMAQQTGLPLQADARLKEMHFGTWDGQEIDQVWQEHRQLLSAWRQDPSAHTPPEGEPLADVDQRVKAWYADVLQEYAGKKVLCVTHGGIIRVILATVMQLPISLLNRFDVPYACVSRVNAFHTDDGLIERLQAHNF